MEDVNQLKTKLSSDIQEVLKLKETVSDNTENIIAVSKVNLRQSKKMTELVNAFETGFLYGNNKALTGTLPCHEVYKFNSNLTNTGPVSSKVKYDFSVPFSKTPQVLLTRSHTTGVNGYKNDVRFSVFNTEPKYFEVLCVVDKKSRVSSFSVDYLVIPRE